MATIPDLAAANPTGDVHDLTETELITYIGLLGLVLVDTVTNQHDNEGEHLLAQGLLSARPSAGNAGKVYVATTNIAGDDISAAPTVWIDNGTAWTNVTDLSSARLIYTHAQHTNLKKISTALDYILATYNVGGTIKGSSVIVNPTDPQVLPTGGNLDDLATAIDEKLDDLDGASLNVDYDTTMSLQAAITQIRASLTALAAPIEWNATDFDHILESDTTQAAINQRLDNAIRKTGVAYTSDSFKHTPVGGGIFGASQKTLQAILNAVESATSAYADTQILQVFFPGDVDTTIAATTAGWAHAWVIPEDPTGSGVLGDVYVDQFYGKLLTEDADDDVVVKFKKNTFSGTPAGTPGFTIAAGNGEGKDVANSLEIDAEHDYIGVNLAFTDTGLDTAADLIISCRLVKLRNMSDWSS